MKTAYFTWQGTEENNKSSQLYVKTTDLQGVVRRSTTTESSPGGVGLVAQSCFPLQGTYGSFRTSLPNLLCKIIKVSPFLHGFLIKQKERFTVLSTVRQNIESAKGCTRKYDRICGRLGGVGLVAYSSFPLQGTYGSFRTSLPNLLCKIIKASPFLHGFLIKHIERIVKLHTHVKIFYTFEHLSNSFFYKAMACTILGGKWSRLPERMDSRMYLDSTNWLFKISRESMTASHWYLVRAKTSS